MAKRASKPGAKPAWKVVEVQGRDADGAFTHFLIADHDASEGAILRQEEAVYGQVADRQTADIVVKAVNSWPDLVETLKLFLDRVEASGDWEDGCFYFEGKSASSLERPIIRARELLDLLGARS